MTQENVGHNNFSSDPTVATEALKAGRTRRNVILIVAVLCVVAVIAMGLVPRLFLNRDLRKQASQQAATAANVFVTPAQASPSSVSVQLSGTMSPITEAPVVARTDGYLKKRLVDIGDHVHTGQILGVIEAPDLDQQVQQAKALYEQSKSTLEQSQAALDQAKSNAGIAGITAERWEALVKGCSVTTSE
jgi:multidrug efflux pump subunit AcrA (membrane-fusion protein)